MLTGEQYKQSLDGRAAFFEGRRVDDPSSHPLLGVAVQNVADGYDWLASQAVDGVDGMIGVPTTAAELRAKVVLVHRVGMIAHVSDTSAMTLAQSAVVGALPTNASGKILERELRQWPAHELVDR